MRLTINHLLPILFPRVIPHGREVCVEDLVPHVGHTRQAPVAAVLRFVRRRSWLPVPRRVAVRSELRHARNVQEPRLPSVALDALRRLCDHRVDPRVLFAQVVVGGLWFTLVGARTAGVPCAVAAMHFESVHTPDPL
jgi:hypothetical protein